MCVRKEVAIGWGRGLLQGVAAALTKLTVLAAVFPLPISSLMQHDALLRHFQLPRQIMAIIIIIIIIAIIINIIQL